MSGTIVPLFPGVPGGVELLVILLIAVLLFGANKIPKLARSTGEAMGEFQKGREEVEQELEEMREGATPSDSTTEAASDSKTEAAGDSATETTEEKTTESSSN
ncbi:twin-arginine translocase TatA/TatE family subunit [Haloarcula salinisoli]|uniref:Sec-independent protein translocase protein TatA n=1 Tax=Haloarcula salinisoli TaxID=2487746 RepID=A0A8J7YBP1_9EURY|nr:twin-arginine translocase TatA/TatE family subunit [Halomicroarcula salinisoli]MBX0285556.1 twin-arginine translocase TatA/TatE family subunit [Halomicroarcula salinisoli]MBX0302960.1 twin-arginine translocase TatA/TatE family subunit [Halomicroarcula salinisoli]